jgi:hypothetical protein
MSGKEVIDCVSIDAGADLSALQFTALKMGTGRAVISAAAATAPIIGILQNKPTSGRAAEVAIGGISKALAGAAGWTSGDKLTATTGGALITTTTDKNYQAGIALETVAAGAYGQVLLTPGATVSI